ncbi:MAG: T9SS type A sorting domain-containing protein [Owenweeksia sp.]
MKQWIPIAILAVSTMPAFSQSGSVALEEIASPEPHNFAKFGSEVLVDGDQAIVLAKGYSAEPGSNGAFYAYTAEPNSGTWQFSQKVVHNSLTPVTEWYGSSAALSGDFLLVGAHSARDFEGQGYPAGAAFMYHRNSSGKWQLEQRLSILSGEEASGQRFGAKVALDGNYAAILAGTTQEIYIFESQGSGSWKFVQKISGSDYLRTDGFKPDFGTSISIDGEYLYIGAPTDDSDAYGSNAINRSGAVYVFKRTGGNWTLDQKVTQQTREAQTYFGSNVEVSGDLMIVSSQEKRQGVVQIFQRDRDGVWSFLQKLTPEVRSDLDRFGSDMAIDENHIAIAAPNYEVNGIAYAGAVFLYGKEAGSNHWIIEDLITAPNPAGSERMGTVQLNDGVVIVGLPSRNISDSRYAGVIYVSKLPSSGSDAITESNGPLRMYPNPAKGSFNLEYTGKELIESIHVFDYSGRQVNVKYVQGQSAVDTKHLSPGVYLVKIQLESGEILNRELTIASY